MDSRWDGEKEKRSKKTESKRRGMYRSPARIFSLVGEDRVVLVPYGIALRWRRS